MKEIQLQNKHLLLVVLLAGMAFIVLSVNKPIGDFGNYYYGSRVASEHVLRAHAVYDVFHFNTAVEQYGEQQFFLNHNPVPPQSILLYKPFSVFSPAHTAKIVFNCFSLLVLIFALHRFLKSRGEHVEWSTAVLLIAGLIPMYYNILFGQTYLILASLIMLSLLEKDKRPWLSGMFLAIAIALKVTPAILLVYFLAEKRFRIIGWTLAFGAAITVLTILLVPGILTPALYYAMSAMPRMSLGYVSDPYSSSFQGVIVFLRKLMVPDTILNPSPMIQGTESVAYVLSVLVFVVFAFLLLGAWKKETDMRKKILLLLLLSSITSGYSSSYSYFLFIPFITTGNSKTDWIRVMLYAAIFLFPPRIFDGFSPILEEYKLWLLIIVFILEIKPTFGFARIEKPQLIVAVVLLCMIVLKFLQRPEQLPLTYYKPDQVKNDFILTAYYTDSTVYYVSNVPQGFGQFSVPYNGTGYNGESGQESFYLNRVHFVPVGQRNDSILVLSDYHRGPGLYHLYLFSKRDKERLSAEQ